MQSHEWHRKFWKIVIKFVLWIKSKQKIYLPLVDNYSAYQLVTNLKCLKFVFLLPNVTSVSQSNNLLTVTADDDDVPSTKLLSMVDERRQDFFGSINLLPTLVEKITNVDNFIAMCASVTEDDIVQDVQE